MFANDQGREKSKSWQGRVQVQLIFETMKFFSIGNIFDQDTSFKCVRRPCRTVEKRMEPFGVSQYQRQIMPIVTNMIGTINRYGRKTIFPTA